MNTTTNCATSADGTIVGTPNPTQVVTTTPGFSGTLPAGIYFVEYGYYTSTGTVTLPSPEIVVQLTSTGNIMINSPASGIPAGVIGVNVYVGTASGSETLQGQTVGASSFVLSVPLVAGTAPATANNTVCKQIANDAGWPTGTSYKVALYDASGNAVPGYPTSWQLLGPNTTINVSQGLPYSNGVVVFPTPLLANPYNHNTQSIASSLNFGGYSITNLGNLGITGSIDSMFLPPTIPQAVTKAGTTGGVLIPPTYVGTEAWTNPNNVRIVDWRPYNSNSAANYNGYSPMPQTTVKASDYGALCNGTNDDTAAIQAAANAVVALSGGTGGGQTYMGSATVELPQGRCEISAPITLTDYGSLIGNGNGTWIFPLEPWLGGTNGAMVILTTSYNPSSTTGNHGVRNSQINRRIQNLNFEYNYNATQHTAIQVINPTGHSAAQPYPNGSASDPQPYQVPSVSIDHVSVYAMDEAFDLEDCNLCSVTYSTVNAVRLGINDTNSYSLVLTGDNIQQGSFAYTPVTAGGSNGYTTGVYTHSDPRWSCTGGTAPGCGGGTTAQNVIASPQGIAFTDSVFEAFDTDANFINILGLTIKGGGFDNGGVVSGSTGSPTIYLGNVKFAQIDDTFCATGSTTSDCIQIAGVTQAQGAGLGNQDGIWIRGSFVYGYNPTTGSGINFLTGGGTGSGFARRNVWITDNQFANVNYAVNNQSSLTLSHIDGNYANTIGTAMFNFPLSTAASYQNTFVGGNLAPVNTPNKLVYATGASTDVLGLIIGTNSTGNSTFGGQRTGTQVAQIAGCSIAAGSGPGGSCTTNLAFAQPWLDTNYRVTGCTVGGATAPAQIGAYTKTNGLQMQVTEVALTAAATSGGTITCSTQDQ